MSDVSEAAVRPVLSMRGLRKHFGGREVLTGIDLDVFPGETVALLGPSGAGKSTLLRCANMLERPDGGSVWFDGELIGYEQERTGLRALGERRMGRQRQEMSMVFQSFNLFPHWTALRNITEGPRHVRGVSREEAEQTARRLLDRVGLGDREDAYPAQMSGGQQQRVAIARALAMRPKLVLFDEPTSALDPSNVGEVISVMKELAQDGVTMLVVTHEIGFAHEAADRVVVMAQGGIVEQGEAREVLDNPRTDVTRAFLGLGARA